MKALKVRDGDLVLRGGKFETVSGYHKVVQDLGFGMAEPLGNDRFHPDWGSMLDSYIGDQVSDETRLLVRSEVTRIVRNYMLQQRRHLSQTSDRGLRNHLTADEVVAGIQEIKMRTVRDTIHVSVAIATGARDPVVLNLVMEES